MASYIYTGDEVFKHDWTEKFKRSLPPVPPVEVSPPKHGCIAQKQVFGYNFTNPCRGLAIVISNQTFDYDKEGKLTRDYAEKELNLTHEVFYAMGFDVFLFKDLTQKQTNHILEEARKSEVHSKSDTFAFVIATHGHEGLEHGQEIHDYVSATDVRMDTSDIMNKFGDETCPGLRGKPRIFFFQACRSRQAGETELEQLENKTDTGVNILVTNDKQKRPLDPGSSDKDSVEGLCEWFKGILSGMIPNTAPGNSIAILPEFLVPIKNEFLVVHSSVPGKRSYGKSENGGQVAGGWMLIALYVTMKNKMITGEPILPDSCQINMLEIIREVQHLISTHNYFTLNAEDPQKRPEYTSIIKGSKSCVILQHKLTDDILFRRKVERY